MAESDTADAAHLCDLCTKTYVRRDLLMRHRRRCAQSKKSTTRRKACDACVQAKAKCCYSFPRCSRCAKREISCHYAPGSVNDRSSPSRTCGSEIGDNGTASTNGSSPTSNCIVADSIETVPWDFTSLDVPMQGVVSRGEVVLPDFGPAYSLSDLPTSSISTDTQSMMNPLAPNNIQSTRSASQLTMPNVTASRSSITNFSDNTATEYTFNFDASSCNTKALMGYLGEYPGLLLADGYTNPFLHRSLYSDVVPDIATLPFTSMAICCSSGIKLPTSVRYTKRAIETERKRLIEAFPVLMCMQQWDALHAMLLYEALELGSSLDEDETAYWKQKPRTKGLQSPFLLKMTRHFSKSYPELKNHDLNVFWGSSSAPTSSSQSPWARWRITETARRTIFLANILNFLSNFDHETKLQLPYYEALDDDLILDMPLPCRHALWNARTEEEWKTELQSQGTIGTTRSSFHEPNAVNPKLTILLRERGSLRTVLSEFTKDFIKTSLATSIGFETSETLRSFIILCALQQFPSSGF